MTAYQFFPLERPVVSSKREISDIGGVALAIAPVAPPVATPSVFPARVPARAPMRLGHRPHGA